MNKNFCICLEKIGLGWMICNIGISVTDNPFTRTMCLIAYIVYTIGVVGKGGDE